MIIVTDTIRLRPVLQGEFKKALPWYQDSEIQYLVNGIKHPYESDMVQRMFDFLSTHGECYFIEVLEQNIWKPIGDATLLKNTEDDLPITIGNKEYWGRGIGTLVAKALIQKAKEQRRSSLKVQCYDFNERSINLYTSLGFEKSEEKTELGHVYYLKL